MNKLKKLFLAVIAILVFAPIASVYATPVGTIDLRLEQPVIGESVEPGANGMTIADVRPKWSSRFSLTSYWIEEPNPAVPMESLNTTFVADTDYYVYTRVELEPDYVFDNLSKVTFNGVEVRNVDYHETQRVVEVITKIRAKAPNVVAPGATESYKVKFNIVNGVDYAEEYTEQIANAENGYKVTNPGHPNTEKAVFIGWYTDQTYKTKFDFTKPITKDTTVYAKYELLSDIRMTLKSTIDGLNLVATSTLTEMEALNLYKTNINYDVTPTITLCYNNIPELIGDNIRLYFNNTYVYSGNELYVSFYYSVTDDYGYESFNEYYYITKVKYADDDTRDELLSELSSTIKDSIDNEIIFLDYTQMSNTEIYTEEEIINYVTDKIKDIDTENKFTIEPLIVIPSVFGYDYQWYEYAIALVNGTHVYDYISHGIRYAYKVDVDPTVDDTHAAYVEDVKERLYDFFVNEKGYNKEDITIDPTSVSSLFPGSRTYLEIGNDLFSIYMIKNSDSILLAKNMLVDSYTYQNRNIWGMSYSENKDQIPEFVGENILEGIETLKAQIEEEGYDFFEGYYIYAYVPEGKTINVTFTVGDENNNRRFKVLHRKDNGEIETFEGIVKDGRFTIEITEGSPFVVGLGEVVKEVNGNPQTYDSVVIYLTIFGLSLVGLLSSIVYKRRLNI